MRVKVAHAGRDLSDPGDEEGGGQVLAVPQDVVQLAVRAKLHHDAVARRLDAYPSVTMEP